MISGNENDYDTQLRWKQTSPERFLVCYGFDDPAKADLDFIGKKHKRGD